MELLARNRCGHRKEDAKIYGFIHICIANQWKDIFIEQVQKIQDSGLYDKSDSIYCGIVGNIPVDFVRDLRLEKFKLAYIHHDIGQFEFLTLEFLHDFCKRNYDAKVFYIHTKGISTYGRVCNPPSPARQKNIDDWRRYMEYYIIENHNLCIDALDEADMVGVDWRGKGSDSIITPQVPGHFSGNFWWARASHISGLEEVRDGPDKRCNAEFWLGKGDGIVTSLYESDIDHYRQGWPLEKYFNEIMMRSFKVKDGISERIYYEKAI